VGGYFLGGAEETLSEAIRLQALLGNIKERINMQSRAHNQSQSQSAKNKKVWVAKNNQKPSKKKRKQTGK